MSAYHSHLACACSLKSATCALPHLPQCLGQESYTSTRGTLAGTREYKDLLLIFFFVIFFSLDLHYSGHSHLASFGFRKLHFVTIWDDDQKMLTFVGCQSVELTAQEMFSFSKGTKGILCQALIEIVEVSKENFYYVKTEAFLRHFYSIFFDLTHPFISKLHQRSSPCMLITLFVGTYIIPLSISMQYNYLVMFYKVLLNLSPLCYVLAGREEEQFYGNPLMTDSRLTLAHSLTLSMSARCTKVLRV